MSGPLTISCATRREWGVGGGQSERWFLVSWYGYGHEWDTWEPEKGIRKTRAFARHFSDGIQAGGGERRQTRAKGFPGTACTGRGQERLGQKFRQPNNYDSLFSQAGEGTVCVGETLITSTPYSTTPNPSAKNAAGAPMARQRGYVCNACL